MGVFKPNSARVPANILSDDELRALPMQAIDELPDEESVGVPAHLERRVEAHRPLFEVGAFEPDLGSLQESVLSLSSVATVLSEQANLGAYNIGHTL